MSDTLNNEAPKLSILEQLKQQHAQYAAQRDMTQTNLNQLVGAIYACEVMIKKHEEEEKELKNNEECANSTNESELELGAA